MIKTVRELLLELRRVLGRAGLLDAILPPATFLILNSLAGFMPALAGAVGMAGVFSLIRLLRRQALLHALGGLAGVLLAVILALVIGRSEAFYLPGMFNGVILLMLAVTSLVIRKPLVAWTSYFARRWPLDWYWHARVRPAYSEVTLFWIVFFALRLLGQAFLYGPGAAGQLGWFNLWMGWPATILLLAASYLYGTRWLSHLGGPSVEEFRLQSPPPWKGQRQGF